MQENNGNNNQKQGGLSWSAPAAQTPAQKSVTQTKPAASVKMPEGGSSSTGKYVGMVAAGIVAGALIAWGWSAFRAPSSTVSESDTTKTDTSTTASDNTNLGVDTSSVPALGSDPALSIMSPQSAGASVAISKAIVTTPTWVVVYEDNNGKPGNALGAALFFPERQTGTVELLRATTAGKSYLVAKQVDNGDRKFSLKDDQFLSEGGVVQWVTFKAN